MSFNQMSSLLIGEKYMHTINENCQVSIERDAKEANNIFTKFMTSFIIDEYDKMKEEVDIINAYLQNNEPFKNYYIKPLNNFSQKPQPPNNYYYCEKKFKGIIYTIFQFNQLHLDEKNFRICSYENLQNIAQILVEIGIQAPAISIDYFLVDQNKKIYLGIIEGYNYNLKSNDKIEKKNKLTETNPGIYLANLWIQMFCFSFGGESLLNEVTLLLNDNQISDQEIAFKIEENARFLFSRKFIPLNMFFNTIKLILYRREGIETVKEILKHIALAEKGDLLRSIVELRKWPIYFSNKSFETNFQAFIYLKQFVEKMAKFSSFSFNFSEKDLAFSAFEWIELMFNRLNNLLQKMEGNQTFDSEWDIFLLQKFQDKNDEVRSIDSSNQNLQREIMELQKRQSLSNLLHESNQKAIGEYHHKIKSLEDEISKLKIIDLETKQVNIHLTEKFENIIKQNEKLKNEINDFQNSFLQISGIAGKEVTPQNIMEMIIQMKEVKLEREEESNNKIYPENINNIENLRAKKNSEFFGDISVLSIYNKEINQNSKEDISQIQIQKQKFDIDIINSKIEVLKNISIESPNKLKSFENLVHSNEKSQEIKFENNNEIENELNLVSKDSLGNSFILNEIMPSNKESLIKQLQGNMKVQCETITELEKQKEIWEVRFQKIKEIVGIIVSNLKVPITKKTTIPQDCFRNEDSNFEELLQLLSELNSKIEKNEQEAINSKNKLKITEDEEALKNIAKITRMKNGAPALIQSINDLIMNFVNE